VYKNIPAFYLFGTYSWFNLFTVLFKHYETITIGRLLLNNVLINRSSPLHTYVLSTFLSVLTQASYVQNPLRPNGCFTHQHTLHSKIVPFTHRRLLCAFYGSSWERLVLCETLIIVCYNGEGVCLLSVMNGVFNSSVPASVHCTVMLAFRVNIFKTSPLFVEAVA
jgi:hypothetical protein